jgi:competence ComEA-like helix-hairpin-helix protein
MPSEGESPAAPRSQRRLVAFLLLVVLGLLVRVYVGGVRSVLTVPASALAPAVLDLNVATVDQLALLPGVGPSRARAIAEDRRRRGPFRSVDDVARVKGIGPRVLASLRESAVVVK